MIANTGGGQAECILCHQSKIHYSRQYIIGSETNYCCSFIAERTSHYFHIHKLIHVPRSVFVINEYLEFIFLDGRRHHRFC